MIKQIDSKLSKLAEKLLSLQTARFNIPLPNTKADVAKYEVLINKCNQSLAKYHAQIEVLKELKASIETEQSIAEKCFNEAEVLRRKLEQTAYETELKYQIELLEELDKRFTKSKLTTIERFKIAENRPNKEQRLKTAVQIMQDVINEFF